MKKDNYIVILAWMNDLSLSLVEKTVYAIIYGFSQDGDSEFSGSRQYLAEWCGCSSLRTIDAALRTLTDRELITKRTRLVKGVKFCSYVANCAGSAKIAQGVAQNCPEGSAKIAHNNIDNNADNKLSANRDNMERTPAFDFKKSLISIGVSEQVAADWMTVRKAKKATNTETAFTALKNQIEKICRQQGVTADDVARFAVGKDWKGINAEWDEVKKMKQNNGTHSGHITIDPNDDYNPGW